MFSLHAPNPETVPKDRFDTLKYISKVRRKNYKLRAKEFFIRSVSICCIFMILFGGSFLGDKFANKSEGKRVVVSLKNEMTRQFSTLHRKLLQLGGEEEIIEGDENPEEEARGGEEENPANDGGGAPVGGGGDVAEEVEELGEEEPDECKPRQSDDPCAYVLKYGEGVCDDEGYIPYTKFYFCTVGDSKASPLAVIFLVVIVLYYFFLIAGVADDYFSPTMANISEVLRLPHNFAGVTFLAFGNGSPDVFSSLAALTGSSPDLGLAGIMGAGVFVPTFVIAAVILAAPDAQLTRRPLLRDAGFMLITVIYILVLVINRSISIVGALMLLISYVVYVGTVMVGRIIYLRMKGRKGGDDDKDVPLLADGDPSSDIPLDPKKRSSAAPYKVSIASSHHYPDVFADDDGHETSEYSHKDRPLPQSIKNKYMTTHQLARQLRRQRRRSIASVFLGHGQHKNKASMYATMQSRPGSRNPSFLIGAGEASSRSNSMFYAYDSGSQAHGNTLAVPGMNLRGIHAELASGISSTTYSLKPKNKDEKVSAKERWRRVKVKLFAVRRFSTAVEEGEAIRLQTMDGENNEVGDQMGLDEIGEEEEEEQGACSRCMEHFTDVIGFIFEYLWKYTIPLVSVEDWDRWLNIAHCVTVPSFTLIVVGAPAATLGGTLPVMLLTFILGGAVAFFVWYKSRDDPEKPIFVLFFLILAFISGALWVFLISQELVSLLGTLGIISGINQAVLGLTVLAWGNSVPDTISNTAVAKLGYPGMATGAAFGEPLLNHLFALGIAMTINTIRAAPNNFVMPRNGNILFCAIFEIVAMVSHIIIFPIVGFKLKKQYAYYLFAIYFVFLILNLLNTAGVFAFG